MDQMAITNVSFGPAAKPGRDYSIGKKIGVKVKRSLESSARVSTIDMSARLPPIPVRCGP